MKYFTPDLMARLASSNEDVANAATAEWDRAAQQYADHLDRFLPALPEDARRLMSDFHLHDAKVLMMGIGETAATKGDPTFSMILRLDNERDRWMQINYGLGGPVVFKDHTEFFQGDEPYEWLYDEMDVDPDSKAFMHSILFTNTLEMTVRFTKLDLRQFAMQPLQIPAHAAGRLGGLLFPAVA